MVPVWYAPTACQLALIPTWGTFFLKKDENVAAFDGSDVVVVVSKKKSPCRAVCVSIQVDVSVWAVHFWRFHERMEVLTNGGTPFHQVEMARSGTSLVNFRVYHATF